MATRLSGGSGVVSAGKHPGAVRRAIHAIYRKHWRLPGLRRVLDLIPAGESAVVAEVTLWGGGRLTFPWGPAGLARSVWKVGAYEDLKTLLVARLAPGRVVYDIGANVGYFTVISASAGATQTVAIEPFPGNLEFLFANIARNKLAGVTVLEMAASNVEGVAPLHDGLGFGTGSLSLTDGVSSRVIATVRVGPLDTELEREHLPGPDLVKLDVEGFEGHAIAGFTKAIRRTQPIVFCELNEPLLKAAGTSSGEILGQLSSLGYSRFLDVGGRKARELDPGVSFEALAYTNLRAAEVETALRR